MDRHPVQPDGISRPRGWRRQSTPWLGSFTAKSWTLDSSRSGDGHLMMMMIVMLVVQSQPKLSHQLDRRNLFRLLRLFMGCYLGRSAAKTLDLGLKTAGSTEPGRHEGINSLSRHGATGRYNWQPGKTGVSGAFWGPGGGSKTCSS